MVQHTPAGVSAVYESVDDVLASGTTVSGTTVISDSASLSEQLERFEDVDVDEFVSAIDFDSSYLILSRTTVDSYSQEITDVTVDAIKQAADGLQLNVHCRADGDCTEEAQPISVLVAVTSDGELPSRSSVSVNWFEVVQCTAEYAPYHRLPEPVQREVDVAVAEGRYEAESTLLYSLAVTEDAILWQDNEYYSSRIDGRDGNTILTFDPVSEASAESPAVVRFYNDRSETLAVSVSVTDSRGELLAKEDLTLENPDGQNPFTTAGPYIPDTDGLPAVETTAVFDEYELTIETCDGERFTEPFEINPDHHDRLVAFFEDREHFDDIELRTEFALSDRDPHVFGGTCRRIGGWWGTTCGID